MISPGNSKVPFTKKDVEELFHTATRVLRNPGLDILLAPKKLALGRLLIITPRKIGTAPERNKVRRQFKALFHEQQLSKGQYDCIIIMKKAGINSKFLQLKEMLLRAYEIMAQKSTQGA